MEISKAIGVTISKGYFKRNSIATKMKTLIRQIQKYSGHRIEKSYQRKKTKSINYGWRKKK